MSPWSQEEIAGWGQFPRLPAQISRPESLRALRQALADAHDTGFLAHGLGRSYGDTALLKDGKLALMTRLDRILDFDPDTGWLHAEAGLSLDTVLRLFVPRGFFPSVTPGTRFVTLGGAFACDVHGKNHHQDGCFSDHVRAFRLMGPDGEIRRVTRETEPAIFEATAGGLGLTGIIVDMELQLRPITTPYIDMESIRVENLDDFIAISSESADFTHHMGWIDCTTRGPGLGRGIFMRGRHADTPPSRQPRLRALQTRLRPLLNVPINAPNWALNPLSVRAFNHLYFHRHPAGLQRQLLPYDPFFYPLDAVHHWNRIYGKRGFLQYQTVIPKREGAEALRALLDAITESGMGSFLAVFKEFGPKTNGGLSFPRPGITLALDFPHHGEPLYHLLDRLDAITLEAQGRVYLAKDARLSRASFRQMYPEWETWRQTRDSLDPEGVFRSAMAERLGLVPTRRHP